MVNVPSALLTGAKPQVYSFITPKELLSAKTILISMLPLMIAADPSALYTVPEIEAPKQRFNESSRNTGTRISLSRDRTDIELPLSVYDEVSVQ